MLLQKTHVFQQFLAWPIVKRVAKVFFTKTTLKPITICIANIETIEGDAILGNFFFFMYCTGKSLSETLIFASTNPQYDNRLLIVYENCKLRIPAEHVVYTNCCFCFALTFRTILVHNIFSRCCELLKKIYLYFHKRFLNSQQHGN